MQKDNIFLGKEAKDKLISGINKACELIRPTYGSAGGNMIVEHTLSPFHEVINDGKTIVDAIKLADPIEKIGANILKEVSDKSEKESGDGRKTTMILTQAIINEGSKVKAMPMEIKKSLDECLPIILKSIDDQTKHITVDEVGLVATIASENEKIGSLIQEIYQKIGKEGIIEIDVSNTFETTYEVKEGIRLRNCALMAPYMTNEGDRAVYKNPYILITKQKISTIGDIDPIFQQLDKKDVRECVIFCDEIDVSVISALSFTHVRGIFKTLIIKAPKLWKDWMYEDFAKITGATIVSPDMGVTLKTVSLEHLGTCEKIISTKEDTTVIGIKDIKDHIAKLEEEGKSNDQLKLRASWLNTKAAVLKLGANSESELNYLTKKTKDARNASYLALKGGVVPGGGFTIANCIENLPSTEGGKILTSVLLSPMRQIYENMGIDFNVEKFDDKVIDPAIVIKNAITNAISVAGIVLTAKGVITLQETKEEINTPNIPIL